MEKKKDKQCVSVLAAIFGQKASNVQAAKFRAKRTQAILFFFFPLGILLSCPSTYNGYSDKVYQIHSMSNPTFQVLTIYSHQRVSQFATPSHQLKRGRQITYSILLSEKPLVSSNYIRYTGTGNTVAFHDTIPQ